MVATIKFDVKSAEKKLYKLERKQIPFAASRALTETAFSTKEHIVRHVWPLAFPNAKNRSFPRRMLKVIKAKKTRLRAVLFDQLDKYILEKNIDGSARIAAGRYIAIPTDNVVQTASGRARKNHQPRHLKNSFTHPVRGGVGLFHRPRKARDSAQLMYLLKPSTSQQRLLPFFEAGYKHAARVWSDEFDKALRRAIQTAKR